MTRPSKATSPSTITRNQARSLATSMIWIAPVAKPGMDVPATSVSVTVGTSVSPIGTTASVTSSGVATASSVEGRGGSTVGETVGGKVTEGEGASISAMDGAVEVNSCPELRAEIRKVAQAVNATNRMTRILPRSRSLENRRRKGEGPSRASLAAGLRSISTAFFATSCACSPSANCKSRGSGSSPRKLT